MNLKEIAVLWDLDGTLLDTFENHYQAWQEVLRPYTTLFNREVFRESFGRNNHTSVAKYFGFQPDESFVDDLVKRKEAIFLRQMPTGVGLFPGVMNWLTFLKKQSVPQAIATSAPKKNLFASVETFHLGPFFDVIAAGDTIRSKPAPDLFLQTAEKLGVAANRCVVIEDSLHGLQAARSAGMVSIGKVGTSDLQPEDADILIAGYTDDPSSIFNHVLELVEKKLALPASKAIG